MQIIYLYIRKVSNWQILAYQKKIAESSDMSEVFGVVSYIDPRIFNNHCNKNEIYKLNGVCSVGALMWQISSGRRPFYAESMINDKV